MAMSLMQIIFAARRDLDDMRGRQWKDDELKGWAQEAHLMVWSELLRKVELYGSREDDITYAASQRHVDLPTALGVTSTVARVHSVADVSDGEPGTSLEPGVYLDQFDANPDGPAKWFLYGTPMQLGITPVPSSGRTLRIMWTPTPTPMADLDDTPDGVPEELQQAIVALVVMKAKQRVGDGDVPVSSTVGMYLNAVPAATRRQNQASRRVRILDPFELLPGGRT